MSVNLLALYDDFKQQWSSALLQCILSARILVWIDIHAPRAVHVFKNNCCSNKKCCQTVDLFFMFCLRDSKEKISANDIESN